MFLVLCVNVHNAFEEIHIECCWSILSCAYYTLYCIMNVVKKLYMGLIITMKSVKLSVLLLGTHA
jgi:hypothetical protein